VIPHKETLPNFIFSLYVNLIPPSTIAGIPAKAPAAIVVTPSAEIEAKVIAPLKASVLIVLTVSGKITDFTKILFLKALVSTVVIPTKSVSINDPSQVIPSI
jgi:hypothetical protein